MNPAGNYFLDAKDCGFFLSGDSFSGAEIFFGNESAKVLKEGFM